jgi:hypothetical protein
MIAATQVLAELLEPNAVIRPRLSVYGKCELELHEPDEVDCVVLIRDVPSDVLAIKADLFPQPRGVFRGSKGECRRADYIVFSENANTIIFVELKLTGAQHNHVTQQLNGAHCLLHYCQEIVFRFWGVSSFLSSCNKRYVHIISSSLHKRPTRPTKQLPARHNTPENHMRIANNSYISFNLLAS